MMAETMNSPICSIMLLDEKKEELIIEATQSLSRAYSENQMSRFKSLLGRSPDRGTGHSGRNPGKRLMYPELAKQEGLRSLVSVP
jgi:hypothetical protein